MNYLAVDLASRFSAGIVVDKKGKVLCEFDSWGKSQIEFAEECAQAAKDYEVVLAMVEDLPYGISKQFQTKPATRLQGILIKSFHDLSLLDVLYFVNPVEWQKTFEIHRSGAEGAREVASKFGFEQRIPIEMYAADIPPLGKEHAKERSKVRAQLKKASTDYDDAYLIGVWTVIEYGRGTLFSRKGVQRYEG